jgi:hypothetical protein
MKRILTFTGVIAAAAALAAAAGQQPDFAAEGRRWWAHIQVLADDALEGRNVGTDGYEKAAAYVERQFRELGLAPGGTEGYRQRVDLESRQLEPERAGLTLVRGDREIPLVIGEDASLSARGELDGTAEAPMVFVGYGLSIPEAGWDDFAGLDLKGRIAVYVNAFPPVTVSDNVRSHVNNATERWLALKRAGAIGVATMAVPRPGSGRGNGRAGGRGGGRGRGTPPPVISLADPDVNDLSGQTVSMSLTASGAAKVLEGSGHTLEELGRLLADEKPLPRFALPGTLEARQALTRETIPSANVAAIFEGSDPVLKSEFAS